MAGGQLALLQQHAHRVGQGEQPHGVGHGGAGLAHLLGHFLLGEAVVLHQDLVAPRLFNGVQVLPLEVLDEAQLHDLPVVGLDDDGGHLGQARQFGGPPAALSGDDLVVAGGQAADGEGLDEPVGADGLGQVAEGFSSNRFRGCLMPGSTWEMGSMTEPPSWVFRAASPSRAPRP